MARTPPGPILDHVPDDATRWPATADLSGLPHRTPLDGRHPVACAAGPGDLDWSCPEPIVGARGQVAVERFVSDIAELPGWDVFETGPLLETSVVTAWLDDAARRHRVVLERFGERESVGISLAGTWESYCATRSRPMSQELRKLSRQGALRFEDYRGGVDLPEKMSHFFRVEASGWKGEQGTAIACHPEAMEFYPALAAEAAAQASAPPVLCLPGRPVSRGEFCPLPRSHHLLSEKIGFDAAWSRFSPGHVLRRLTLEHLFETGETDTLRHASWRRRAPRAERPVGELLPPVRQDAAPSSTQPDGGGREARSKQSGLDS